MEGGEKISVNGTEFDVVRLLGKGKGGYSYLSERGGNLFVVKQIHHEPCAYYTFGNKIESERRDYGRLIGAGIPVPKMLGIDVQNERILKEYIEGKTIFELVKDDRMEGCYIDLVRKMAEKSRNAGMNIDYFPTNFVVRENELFYIDYECNDYMDEWNFENWGIKYWSKTDEFMKYVSEHQ